MRPGYIRWDEMRLQQFGDDYIRWDESRLCDTWEWPWGMMGINDIEPDYVRLEGRWVALDYRLEIKEWDETK